MKEFFFWRVWSVSERRAAVASLLILLLAILFFVLKGFDPLSNVIRWNVLSEVSEISTVVDVLRIGQWQYGVSVPSQLVTENFIASVMETDPVTVGLFWLFALTGLSFLLASLTSLPRFWYLSGMALFIVLLALCRLETLGIFGEGSKGMFLLTTLLYGGTSYYFHAFGTESGIARRVLAMFAVSVLLVTLVLVASPLPVPGLAAVAYSTPFWLLLTVIFLLVISTELMALFVWISTSGSGKKGKPALINFVVISVLFLLMLTLQYLRNTKQIDWNMTLVGSAYLAIAAAIAGIWGFQKRANSMGGLMPFRSAGFWFYIGLFLIAASFSAFTLGTANDPLLEVLEDVVIQGQLGMSVLFFFYILVNFFPLFKQGLEVHKVLYKPMRFGLTQARLFGVVAVFVLFSIQRLLPVNQGIAGYFNGLGDLYSKTGEYTLAEQYYKMALQQEFQNHKSNYALASLALRQGDNNAAAYYFRQALLKNPSAEAYAGLGSILVQENLFFDAIYSLQEGIRVFPESGELQNNLGMLYSRTNVADSAYYYLEKAEKNSRNQDVPATNLLAILAKNTDVQLLDSLTSQSKERGYISWQANWLAVQNLKQQFPKQSFHKDAIPKDSLLSVSSFAYMQNYALNQARNDSMPATILRDLAVRNPLLSQDLSLAAFYPEFYSGNKQRAIEAITAWAEDGGDQENLYRKIGGHWFLQLGLYEKAMEQLSVVEGEEGTLGMAIAHALSGNDAVAVILLDKLQEKQPAISLDPLRKTLLSGTRPMSKADSLITVAKKSNRDSDYDLAVKANPFSGKAVSAAADWYRQKKQIPKAYNMVVNALRLNDYAPELWEQYAYLSLAQGLTEQAESGEEKVKQYALPADYQQFMSRYQPMRALIEKQRADFK
jgi:tetratricopeptide (TPR) repeat protein